MNIYIPSRSRAGNVLTLTTIPEQWRDNTFLVVPKSQEKEYTRAHGKYAHILAPPRVNGIHNVRQWICDHEPDAALMMDDDMVFYHRADMELATLRACTPSQMRAMLVKLEVQSQKFWGVAISARQGNNRHTTPYVDVHRMNNVYAINTAMLKEGGARFDRLKVMEDFDVTLTMLRAGYQNRVYYRWAWNQLGSGKEGGCSDYRTGEMQANAAHALHKLHPDFVKVVQKESKSGWDGMKVRTDVRMQWKKAFAESQK